MIARELNENTPGAQASEAKFEFSRRHVTAVGEVLSSLQRDEQRRK